MKTPKEILDENLKADVRLATELRNAEEKYHRAAHDTVELARADVIVAEEALRKAEQEELKLRKQAIKFKNAERALNLKATRKYRSHSKNFK